MKGMRFMHIMCGNGVGLGIWELYESILCQCDVATCVKCFGMLEFCLV